MSLLSSFQESRSVSWKELQTFRQAHLKQQSPAKSTSTSSVSRPSVNSANKNVRTLDETNNEQDKESGPSRSQEVEDTSSECVHHVMPMTTISTTVSSELLSANDQFDSFDDFKQKLEAYCKENCLQFIISKSCSVQSVNKNKGENSRKLDDKLVYSSIKYTCKYGQKRPSRSAGIRPNQR